MSDSLTVLRCAPNLVMAKTLHADRITPYSLAKTFDAALYPVDDIDMLSELLSHLERDPRSCIVRATPKDGTKPLRRLLEHFDDNPLHTILVEVDSYRPLLSDPVHEPLDAALEYVAECLPPCFHGASFHLQLSNSAGTAGKEGVFKAHLWMWLETPYDSATLRAWAKVEGLNLDRAVLQPTQIHYTAAPILDGVADPVPLRSLFHRGVRDDVPLVIDTEALAVKAQGVRQRGERLDVEDPIADWLETHWEVWGELANGGVLVSCPWEDGHSGGAKGDTSSVYFPAGSNGYADGQFVCLHNSCSERHRSDFLQAVGYGETRLAALAATPEAVHPTRVNGHALNDPLLLPQFKRDGTGGIFATPANVSIALAHPHVIDMDIRMDTFREELMWTPADGDAWRPFADTDFMECRMRLEARGFKSLKRQELRDMVHHHAASHSFDTAQDWLNGLAWDGVKRIETFWTDRFGVPDDPRGYARAVGRYAWTAMAGRVLLPGAQADMVPILTGPQGMGKSRGIAAMAPAPEFATTMSFHEAEVERARKMRGTLVVELAELQGLKSREREEILAWVTRSMEHWTPKWQEMSKTFFRRFVLYGTTNDDDFLDDASGERRWLPLGCGRSEGFSGVAIDAIVRDRDQLWAEGRETFKSHGILWQDAERLAREEHGAYKAHDAWQWAVRRWLTRPDMGGETPAQRGHITTLDVAEGALGIPVKQLRYADQRRIAKLLREEGYVDTVRRVDGRSAKVWLVADFV